MTDFAHLGTAPGEPWTDWRADNATADDRLVSLRRESRPSYEDAAAVFELSASEPSIAAFDVDNCGELYLLCESGMLTHLGRNGLRPLRCDGAQLDGEPRALLVDENTFYVAEATIGANEPAGRLYALSREGRQLRWVEPISDGVPVALVSDDTGVYVLVGRGDTGYLARCDPGGSIQPVVEGYRDPLDLAIDAGVASVLDATPHGPVLRRTETASLDPTTVRSAPDSWVEAPSAHVYYLAGEGEDAALVARDDPLADEPTLVRVTDSSTEELIGLPDGIDGLVRSDLLYVLAADGREIHVLEPRRRFARNDATDSYDAQLVRGFDAGESGTEWHRVTLGFSNSGAESQVRLSYAATEDPDPPDIADWHSHVPANPHDALLEDAVGRYLWLRVELSGSESASPTLASVRVYFPRQSYLRYLPTVYQDDAESRAFLEAFLSIFESTFVDVGEELEGVTRHLDSQGIPPEYLDWLGSWLALDPDETWPTEARRELLERAPELFRARGTPNGLLELVGLYADHVEKQPTGWDSLRTRQLEAAEARASREESPVDTGAVCRRIQSAVFLLEHLDLDCADDEAAGPYRRLLDCPQCFFVFVRPFVTDEQLRTIQRLVDEHRPAHAVGRAVRLEPSILLGGHSYLGVNTVLADRDLVVGESELGRTTVLDDREPHGQLAVRSRLGVDTNLS